MTEKQNVSPVDQPKVGERVRIAILRNNTWVPICWLRIGYDGSIYFGLLFGKPTKGGMLKKKSKSKLVKIEYDQIQEFEQGKIPSSSRVSFKSSSGEIHLGDKVIQGQPLDTLTKRTQLLLFHQTHPDNISNPEKTNTNDYDIGIGGYTFEENKPLLGSVFVSPYNPNQEISPIKPLNLEDSISIPLIFRGFSQTPDLLIQIVLGHGPEGPWPDLAGILIITQQ
ncbi:hypothetical protein KA005_26765 [bacterium]|nr:hypothetical protein [bacterium]